MTGVLGGHQRIDQRSRSQPYLDAWREILNRPLEEVL
jgi:hypothetical protein